ncbi:MAG: hypothetical protein PUA50_00290 [Eubacteriales bacterium]|nr:hypothetical protein [Eubacteriales bacterium]
MSKITVPLSATGTYLVCEDPTVRILSKTVGVYYIKLTLDSYWTKGEENILLMVKKKNENLSTVLEYSVDEVSSGAEKEIPSALLETEGVLSVWVGKTPSSGKQMLSGVLELTVEPSGGIITGDDICVKTPLAEYTVDKLRCVDGVFQYNASHGWKTLAGQNKVDEELAKKVDKAEGKGLSTNDYTDEDKQIVNDTLPYAIDINSQAIAILNERKVDKVEGKGLSTNDYTNDDKQLVNEVLPASVNENAAKIEEIRSQKVDKIEGKDLSTNDYTDSAKELLETWMLQEFDRITERVETVEANTHNNHLNKVDKVEGKGLSANDYTDEDKNNLGKLNGKYGLITTINIEEDVATVDYTFENPLSKMFAQVYVPNETVETSDKVIIYAVIEGLTAGWGLMNQLANAIFSTANAYWGYSLDVSEGMLEQYISNVQAVNTGRASYTRQISATQSSFTGQLKSIKQIRFSTPSAFPAGTVFTIYGKEA